MSLESTALSIRQQLPDAKCEDLSQAVNYNAEIVYGDPAFCDGWPWAESYARVLHMAETVIDMIQECWKKNFRDLKAAIGDAMPALEWKDVDWLNRDNDHYVVKMVKNPGSLTYAHCDAAKK